MTGRVGETVRDVLAEMRAKDKPAHFVWGHYADRLEAALARERTQERVAFVQAAIAYAEVANRLPGQPDLVPEADEKWRAFNNAYRAMIAAQKERTDD